MNKAGLPPCRAPSRFVILNYKPAAVILRRTYEMSWLTLKCCCSLSAWILTSR